jgi:hypothetical protein
MRFPFDWRRRSWGWLALSVIAACAGVGCYAPLARDARPAAPIVGAPVGSVDGAVVAAPGSFAAAALADLGTFAPGVGIPASLVETWVVHNRACEQKLGSDPWPSITVGRLDEGGGPIHGADPDALFARMSGRTSVFMVHGNGYTFPDAVREAVGVRAVLEAGGGLGPESLFVIFDWPSERDQTDLIQDLNEKARRSRVAAYHLARILEAAPAGSRICFLAQSNGGRIVLTTLHLLSGAPLRAFWSEPEVHLDSMRPDLRMRAVLIDAAANHQWFNPGDRLDQAVPMSEAILNIHNHADYALAVYIFGVYTGLRPAVGQVGFQPGDLRRLGPLASRIEQINLNPRVGFSHTSIPQALGFSDVAAKIARYTAWNEPPVIARRAARKPLSGLAQRRFSTTTSK